MSGEGAKDTIAQLMLAPGNKALVFCGIEKEDLNLTISLMYILKKIFPTRKSNHRDRNKLLLVLLSLNQKSQYS